MDVVTYHLGCDSIDTYVITRKAPSSIYKLNFEDQSSHCDTDLYRSQLECAFNLCDLTFDLDDNSSGFKLILIPPIVLALYLLLIC